MMDKEQRAAMSQQRWNIGLGFATLLLGLFAVLYLVAFALAPEWPLALFGASMAVSAYCTHRARQSLPTGLQATWVALAIACFVVPTLAVLLVPR